MSDNYKNRSNVWAFVGYPGDSLPENYINIVQNWHIPCLISPIHDKDKNGDETEKKKHIHFLLDFGSGQNKSLSQVQKFSEELNATIPIIVHNKNSMKRYFIHIDNPEKHQYDKKDLIALNGMEFEDAFSSYTNDERYYQFLEDYIYKYKIYNFAEFVHLLKQDNLNYELGFLRRHTIYFNSLLNGMYQKVIMEFPELNKAKYKEKKKKNK